MTTVSEIIDYTIRNDPASLIILRLDVAIVIVFLCRSVGSRRLICYTVPEPATENVHFYWDKQIAMSSVHPSNFSRRVIAYRLAIYAIGFWLLPEEHIENRKLNRFGRSEHSVTL
jgi:hypothetical protein